MAKVNIKLRSIMAGPMGISQPGDIVSMERSAAEALFRKGQAVLSTAAPREMRKPMCDDPGEGPVQVPPYPQPYPPDGLARRVARSVSGGRLAKSVKPRPKQ